MNKEKYRHLINGGIGCYILIYGLWLVEPVMEELVAIIGLIKYMNDKNILDFKNIMENVFFNYIRGGAPVVLVCFLICGVRCLKAFIKLKADRYLRISIIYNIIGYVAMIVIAVSNGVALLKQVIFSSHYLIGMIFFIICVESWRNYLNSQLGKKNWENIKMFPYIHELNVFATEQVKK